MAPLTVKVALSPEQISVLPEADREGAGFTVMVLTALLVQPPEVPVTVYVVVVLGDTVMLLLVALVLQE